MSLVVVAIIVAAVYGVQLLVQRLRSIGGIIDQEVDPNYKPSEQDKQLIDQTKDLVRSHFGGNIADTLMPLTPQQRSEKLVSFTQEIIETYNLEIERLSIQDMGAGLKGGYSAVDNAILINGNYIALDDAEELKDLVDTIIHECEHARQHRMVEHPQEFQGDPAVLESWRRNFEPGCYIHFENDPQGYHDQAVEFDARNFAASIIGEF